MELWWSQKGLPYGFAGFGSFACAEVLAVLSMSQVWYVGPIAIAAGGSPYGMDLGWCDVLPDGIRLTVGCGDRSSDLSYFQIS